MFHLTLNDNIIQDARGEGVTVEVGADLREFSFQGNTVTGSGGSGFLLDCLGAVADAITEHVTISNNIIRDVGQHAIWVDCKEDVAIHQLSNISVSGNTITNPTNDGILIHTDSASTAANLSNFSVGGNTVEEASDAAIHLDIDGDLSNGTVSNNSVDSGDQGISVEVGQHSNNISLVGNAVYGITNSSFYLSLTTDVTNLNLNGNNAQSSIGTSEGYRFIGFGGQALGFSMVGNTAFCGDYNMIWTSIGASGTQANMCFVGNNFRGSTNGISATDPSFDPDGDNVVASNVTDNANDWTDFAAEFTAVLTTGGNKD